MISLISSQSAAELPSESENTTAVQLKTLLSEFNDLKGNLEEFNDAGNANQLLEQRLKNKLKSLQLHIEQLKSDLYPEIIA